MTMIGQAPAAATLAQLKYADPTTGQPAGNVDFTQLEARQYQKRPIVLKIGANQHIALGAAEHKINHLIKASQKQSNGLGLGLFWIGRYFELRSTTEKILRAALPPSPQLDQLLSRRHGDGKLARFLAVAIAKNGLSIEAAGAIVEVWASKEPDWADSLSKRGIALRSGFLSHLFPAKASKDSPGLESLRIALALWEDPTACQTPRPPTPAPRDPTARMERLSEIFDSARTSNALKDRALTTMIRLANTPPINLAATKMLSRIICLYFSSLYRRPNNLELEANIMEFFRSHAERLQAEAGPHADPYVLRNFLDAVGHAIRDLSRQEDKSAICDLFLSEPFGHVVATSRDQSSSTSMLFLATLGSIVQKVEDQERQERACRILLDSPRFHIPVDRDPIPPAVFVGALSSIIYRIANPELKNMACEKLFDDPNFAALASARAEPIKGFFDFLLVGIRNGVDIDPRWKARADQAITRRQ